MTKLVWDSSYAGTYEIGVDKGVISSVLGGIAPWNGLISVEEQEGDSKIVRAQYEGLTHVNLHLGGFYRGNITAYAFPDAFNTINGFIAAVPGFTLTKQKKEIFNFSYRTKIGELGYKIHFVHNVIASQVKAGASSKKDAPTPNLFKWRIEAMPPSSTTYKPTAHIVVDSTKVDSANLVLLENMLYGTVGTSPIFPTQQEIIDLFS